MPCRKAELAFSGSDSGAGVVCRKRDWLRGGGEGLERDRWRSSL